MSEDARKPQTGREILDALCKSGFVGMWKDREDIGDSAEFARKLRTGRSDNLSAYDFDRLVSWFRDPHRQPAHLAFTAGAARDAATAFETAHAVTRGGNGRPPVVEG